MSKFLYGASVQGIQSYIFETNRLKEIIGASKIVESLNKINFKERYSLEKEPKVILQIAGSVILSFEIEEDVKKVFKKFIKDVKEKAYGIVISQAVVSYDDYKEGRAKLEEMLKIQRNIVDIPQDFHFSILKQNPRTAKPLFKVAKEKQKEVFYDKSSWQKLQAFNEFARDEIKNSDEKPIFETEDLSNSKNKIAVIHADGNGLGNLVKDMDENELIEFSDKLDFATNEAAKNAIKRVKNESKAEFKHRVIILDGDDLSIICDATYGLMFTEYFLDEFERLTERIYKGNNLTSSAGIVYCNEKFPLHYAVDLAKSLCLVAKKDSRTIDAILPPSSIMFHNTQSSYVKSYDKFIKDELTLGQNLNGENIRCDFGAYFLKKQENKPKIEDLRKTICDFKEDESPASRLREWLSKLEVSENYAKNDLLRINEITNFTSKNLSNLHKDLSLQNLIVEKDGFKKTPIYDILQILSVEV